MPPPFKKLDPKSDREIWRGAAIESGQRIAVIVKGSGKANLEITLEWERSDKVES